MKTIIKATICLMAFTLLGFSQISNVQFKDLDGNEYDLYEELAKGKSVLVHATGSR
jgi:hypothetical protein